LSADGEGGGPADPGSGEPSEDEIRAAYEAELSRISATDMMAQAAVSLLNIGARRLAPAPAGEDAGGQGQAAQRDLEQARDAIDAVRALLEILDRRIPRELAPLRDALSRLQMAYAREAAPGTASAQPAPPGGGAGAEGKPPDRAPEAPAQGRPDGPGPAESSGRLWVPGR
jgi:hypothetical protein